MANESPNQTLQPTALVHEAWLRLVGDDNRQFANRAHFLSADAEAIVARKLLSVAVTCGPDSKERNYTNSLRGF
jgi:hypothetical protein